MVAKPGFEDANLWLEGERVKFREQLVFFEGGAAIEDATSGLLASADRTGTKNYVAWLKTKIDEMTSLIAQNSIPTGKLYRVIDTHRVPGGTVWTLVRQESDNENDLLVISVHESKADAEAMRAKMERLEMNAPNGR